MNLPNVKLKMFPSLMVDKYFCILINLCSLFKKDKREMTRHYLWPIFIRSLTEFNKNYLLTLKLISRQILLSSQKNMQIYPRRQPTFENWNIPYFYILETKNRNVPDVQNIAETKLTGNLKKRFLKHSPKLKMPLRKSKFGEHLLNSSHKVDSFHWSTEILHMQYIRNTSLHAWPYQRVFNRLHKATHRYPQ